MRRVLTPECWEWMLATSKPKTKEYLMKNRHQPLHDLEDRGGGVPGEKAKEGHAKMNEKLRKSAQPSADAKLTGLSLGEKSPGDVLREQRKQQQLQRFEQHRKKQQ